MSYIDYDVVIVGGGPAGLAAALTLNSFGIDAAVLEAGPTGRKLPGSRALFVHGESLRLLESISPGTGVRLSNEGIRWGFRTTCYAGKVVYTRKETHDRRNYVEPAAYSSIPQYSSVGILRDACEYLGVPIHENTEVTEVILSDNLVEVESTQNVYRAKYVIGADGAKSKVREALGIRLSGPRLDGFHVVVDIPTQGIADATQERLLHYKAPAVGGRNLLTIPFAGGVQFDVQARNLEDQTALLDVSAWLPRLIKQRSEEATSIAGYRFISAIAESFVDDSGRVLLVGEAAHLFPPFGARGMNSALVDGVFAAFGIVLDLNRGGVGGVRHFSEQRSSAARLNSRAAKQGFDVMHAKKGRRVLQSMAARFSRVSSSAGLWLENSPYSSEIRSGGRY